MTRERFKGCGFESHQSRFYLNFPPLPFLFIWLFLKGSRSFFSLYPISVFSTSFQFQPQSPLLLYLPVCPGARAMESRTGGRETEGEGKWAWTPR